MPGLRAHKPGSFSGRTPPTREGKRGFESRYGHARTTTTRRGRTVRVWRVAHESTLQRGFPAGPYNGGVELNDANRDALSDMYGAHCDNDHPSPYWDPSLRGIKETQRCGFNSPDALYEWFAGWTAALDECGFRVWTYDVPDWACTVGSKGQVVFTADEAVEVSSEPLNIKPEQLALFA